MEIEWSLVASKQLESVLDFVESEYGAMTSLNTLRKIEKRINGLKIFPEAGIYDSDLSDDDFIVRHVQIFPNLAYYVQTDNTIIIVTLVHYRQSIETITRLVKKSLEQYR